MKRGVLCVAAAALVVRLAVFAVSSGDLGERLRQAIDSGSLLNAAITFELGEALSAEGAAETHETPAADAFTGTPLPLTPEPDTEVSDDAAASPATAPVSDGTILETTLTGESILRNTTGFTVDVQALLAEELTQVLPAEGPQVLIIHTHSSEAYTPDGTDVYVPTDISRTEDTDYNVVRIGDELAELLESYGVRVVHDREIYDYPSYTGSYSRSGAAVESYLSQYPELAVVIDVHRDALGSDGVVYKTVAELDGKSSAQVMLVVGTGENGLEHPLWRENLKLALTLQNAMNRKYPTLARPLALVPERYNQQLTTGSFILEVGSSGNTLREALAAVRLFGEVAGPILAGMAA